jgi:predicted Fe-Mo cluster-binding NifX family protein
MKICFTAGASSPDAPVNAGLGRCPFFIVVETYEMTAKSIPNSSARFSGRAGTQDAQTMAGLGVTALITENIGQILLNIPSDSAKNTASHSIYGA